jgi:ribosomal protein S18 acetylase RimI-like enzyme
MQIRQANRSDEDALAEIDRLTWSPDVSPASEPPFQPFFAKTDPAEILVAEDDGAVAGYVKLVHPTERHASRHVFEIRGLGVHPERQRRGVGRALLEGAADHAAAHGVRRLTLRVFAVNEGARALYESAGFVVEGVLRGEFFAGGRYVDDVLMARDLAA